MKDKNRFRDEEPDFDEAEWDWFHEGEICPDLCPRCGHQHLEKDCDIVTPDLLKKLK